ncbi:MULTISPECIES: ArsC/Spx/MgsR family protein [unclassified Streptococcus]|uniref:ArsC/Spx/MgsR family protein n=1 Tax=unclassified Streptococcus TaxID=2608887 RepID=UPI00359EAEC0
MSKEDTQVIDALYSEKNDLTIYHNQSCSKSLAVLELLREAGYEPRVINYLTETPSPAELASLGLNAKDLLRRTDQLYTDLELSDDLSDQEIFTLLAEHPSLIERPIVVYKGQALICRPPERVWELVQKK